MAGPVSVELKSIRGRMKGVELFLRSEFHSSITRRGTKLLVDDKKTSEVRAKLGRFLRGNGLENYHPRMKGRTLEVSQAH